MDLIVILKLTPLGKALVLTFFKINYLFDSEIKQNSDFLKLRSISTLKHLQLN